MTQYKGARGGHNEEIKKKYRAKLLRKMLLSGCIYLNELLN